MFKRHKREAITLRRNLGLFEATVAGIGIIIGAGIYVLIGAASGHAGNGVWISFLIAAFVAFLTGLSYAELSSIYSDDSGEYSYAEHTFGKKFAFIVGYLVMFSGIISASAVALGFAGYLNSFFNIQSLIPFAIASIIVFSLINLIGIDKSVKLYTAFTILSVIGLLIIISLAIPYFGSINYIEIKSMPGIFKAASLIFFAFIGFESVVKLAEETKNPKKNIPLALLLSLGISSLIYILVAIAAISIIPWQQLSASEAPLALVAEKVMGNYAGFVLGTIAVLATGNTVLMVLIAMSRMLYSMSKEYPKLEIFSRINSKTKTPHYAVIITGALTLAFILIGNIETVAEITNFTVFVVFAIINAALIKSRYIKHRHEMFHEPLNFGKFPVLALLGLFFNLFMIFNLEKIVILFGIVITGMGFGVYKIIK